MHLLSRSFPVQYKAIDFQNFPAQGIDILLPAGYLALHWVFRPAEHTTHDGLSTKLRTSYYTVSSLLNTTTPRSLSPNIDIVW